jgi:hypothetical protein
MFWVLVGGVVLVLLILGVLFYLGVSERQRPEP